MKHIYYLLFLGFGFLGLIGILFSENWFTLIKGLIMFGVSAFLLSDIVVGKYKDNK